MTIGSGRLVSGTSDSQSEGAGAIPARRSKSEIQIQCMHERITELEYALGWFLADDRFNVMVGGNPNVVPRMLEEAQRIYEGKTRS